MEKVEIWTWIQNWTYQAELFQILFLWSDSHFLLGYCGFKEIGHQKKNVPLPFQYSNFMVQIALTGPFQAFMQN